MTTVKMCGVCGKNEASRNCEVCSIPLCDMCVKEVLLQELSPASMVKPGVSMSPVRPGQTKKKVCAKCMKEADFL